MAAPPRPVAVFVLERGGEPASGQRILGGDDGSGTFRAIARLGRDARAMALRRDRRELLLAAGDGLHVCDLGSGKVALRRPWSELDVVTSDRNGAWVYAAGFASGRLWKLEIDGPGAVELDLLAFPRALAESADGSALYAIESPPGASGRLVEIDLATGRRVLVADDLLMPSGVALASGGAYVSETQAGAISFLPLGGGTRRRVLTGRTSLGGLTRVEDTLFFVENPAATAPFQALSGNHHRSGPARGQVLVLRSDQPPRVLVDGLPALRAIAALAEPRAEEA